jgi:hypothetical protein
MGKNLPGIRTTHASVPHKTPRTKALDPNGSPCSTRSRMDRKNNGLPADTQVLTPDSIYLEVTSRY